MVRTQINLNTFKNIEITSNSFLDHNGLKLETNLKKKTQKHSKTWKINNMLLNDEWVDNEIKEEIKKYLATNENEHITTQNLWNTAKAVPRGKFIALQVYPKKIEKNLK